MILAILVAITSVFLYNPKQAIRTTKAVIDTTSSAIQWARSEWMSMKIATVEYVKQFATPVRMNKENDV